MIGTKHCCCCTEVSNLLFEVDAHNKKKLQTGSGLAKFFFSLQNAEPGPPGPKGAKGHRGPEGRPVRLADSVCVVGLSIQVQTLYCPDT